MKVVVASYIRGAKALSNKGDFWERVWTWALTTCLTNFLMLTLGIRADLAVLKIFIEGGYEAYL